jgi:hypothetical protein
MPPPILRGKTVSLVPQPPVPPLSAPPPGGPVPPSGFWLGVAAAALAVASVIAGICKEIAARWRGIVVAHLFFLTLWMAIQVFFFATGAHWCVPNNGSRVVEWLTRSFAQVVRCGPAPPASAFHGMTAVAAPVPTPDPAPPRPPGAISATPRAQSPAPSSGATSGASLGPSPGARPPPSVSAQQAAPASGPMQSWSSKTIVNCWRNRAIDSGDCYETADPRRRPPTPPPHQPPRYRYLDDSPPSPYYPCRRAYDCWPSDFWGDDDL